MLESWWQRQAVRHVGKMLANTRQLSITASAAQFAHKSGNGSRGGT
jgi:hypothetical protein